jgi:hypothetical protein
MIKYIITMMLLTTACTNTQTSVDEPPVKLHIPEKGDCALYEDNKGWFICKTEDNRYIKVHTDKEYDKRGFPSEVERERLYALNQAQVNFDMLSPTEQWYSIETGDYILATVKADEGEIIMRSHTVRGKVVRWEDMANGEQHTEEIKL